MKILKLFSLLLFFSCFLRPESQNNNWEFFTYSKIFGMYVKKSHSVRLNSKKDGFFITFLKSNLGQELVLPKDKMFDFYTASLSATELEYARKHGFFVDHLDSFFAHDMVAIGFKHSVKAMISYLFPANMADRYFAEVISNIKEWKESYPDFYKLLKQYLREGLIFDDYLFIEKIKEAEVKDRP